VSLRPVRVCVREREKVRQARYRDSRATNREGMPRTMATMTSGDMPEAGSGVSGTGGIG